MIAHDLKYIRTYLHSDTFDEIEETILDALAGKINARKLRENLLFYMTYSHVWDRVYEKVCQFSELRMPAQSTLVALLDQVRELYALSDFHTAKEVESQMIYNSVAVVVDREMLEEIARQMPDPEVFIRERTNEFNTYVIGGVDYYPILTDEWEAWNERREDRK